MSEFDWWSASKLNALVRALRGCDNEPPPSSDEAFWQQVADDCYEADGGEGDPLDPKELASDVHSEFESARLLPSGTNGVSIGDLCCAESRLVGLVKGIQGVVYVASHPMESLWAADGLQYHTIVVSIQEPSHTLSSQLRGACAFLSKHRPALICSSSTALAACVVAAFNYHQAKGAVPILELLTAAQTELNLSTHDVSPSDVQELESFATLVPPTTNMYLSPLAWLVPPPPPSSGPPKRKHNDDDDEADLSRDGPSNPSTPSSMPSKMPSKMASHAFPLVGISSTDSTATQIESEMVDTPNPSKRVTRGSTGRSAGFDALANCRDRPQAPREDAAEGPEEAKVAALALQKYVRGDCSRCEQANVLGWATSVGPFECCACHDVHDEDETSLAFSYDGGIMAV